MPKILERFIVVRQVRLNGSWKTTNEFVSSSAAMSSVIRAEREIAPLALEGLYKEQVFDPDERFRNREAYARYVERSLTSRCNVCGAPLREGALYCPGLSPCWKKENL